MNQLTPPQVELLTDIATKPVAAHVPVQWFGIHDVVTVYDRKR